MKPTKYLLLFIIVALLTACSNSKKEPDEIQNISEVGEASDDSEFISAEKNLFSVEVTLPASMFEGASQEETEAEVKELGIDNVKFHDDGSVTLKMNNSKHQEILDSMKTGIDKSISEMLDDKETYPSFSDITYNKDCTEFTVLCDKSKFTDWETFSALSFYVQGFYYQAFNGVEKDDLKVMAVFKDMDTDEVLFTGDSSDLDN